MKKLSLFSMVAILSIGALSQAATPSLIGTYTGKSLRLNPLNVAQTKIQDCEVRIEASSYGSDQSQGPGYQITFIYPNEKSDASSYIVSQTPSKDRVAVLGVKSTIYSGGHADMADFLDVNSVGGTVKELKATKALGPIFISESCIDLKKSN